MTQRRRSASDALKGTEAKEETLPVVPEAPEGEDKANEPDADATTAAAEGEGAESKAERPEIEPADAAAEDGSEEDPETDESEEDDAEEVDKVEATVVIALFNYFDESGAHCSAVKGTKVHVTHEAAARGLKLGALTVED